MTYFKRWELLKLHLRFAQDISNDNEYKEFIEGVLIVMETIERKEGERVQ